MTSLYSSSSAKERLHLPERLDQRVHIFVRVVHIEGCPSRGRDAEDSHQDLRAVMSRPDAHPFLVEHLGQVVGMDVSIPEGHRAAPSLGVVGPEHPGPYVRESLDRVTSELL